MTSNQLHDFGSISSCQDMTRFRLN